MAGRQPDYSLGALDSSTDEKNPKIGAAWINDDGTISININDFVVLKGNKNLYLRLFPNKQKATYTPPPTPIPPTGVHSTSNLMDDDIPF